MNASDWHYDGSGKSILFDAPDRRFKVLAVSPELLGALLFNTRYDPERGEVMVVELEGMPADARVQALRYEPLWHRVLLRVWSASFPQADISADVEHLNVVCHERRFRVARMPTETEPGLLEPAEATPANPDTVVSPSKSKWETYL